MAACPLRFNCGSSQSIGSSAECSFIDGNDFVKSIQFSFDGSYLLASTESGKFCVYSVPQHVVGEHKFYTAECNTDDTLISDQEFNQQSTFGAGECIYDCKWYPSSIAGDPTR